MLHKLRNHWDSFRTSLWFIPALMTVGAALLAMFMVWVEEHVPSEWISNLGWLYSGSAEGARQILSTVAGSMITVAGVVFSITVVALTLASSQFGPRLLRNFMRDRGNQVVLGTFIATFTYCLLVLRTVRGMDGERFVPHSAVTVGIALALLSLGVLIYFIHHAAMSMQAPTIIAKVSAELRSTIDTLYPARDGDEKDEPDDSGAEGEMPEGFEERAVRIPAPRDGYIQVIDNRSLVRYAAERGLLIRLRRRPGHFVVQGDAVALAARLDADTTHDEDADKRLAHDIFESFVLGPRQTPTQDVEFAFRQLVEIAVRALSPGINDPFTAINCIDHIGAGLTRLAGRRIPSPYWRDENGRLRLVAHRVAFPDVAATAFRQIRQYGAGSTAVLVRLLETIAVVLPHAQRDEDRKALLLHARLIRETAEGLPLKADEQDVDERYRAVMEARP